MSREPIRIRRSFQTSSMRKLLLWGISRRFHRLSPWYGQVAHVLRTLPPVAARVLLPRAAPRLACVKPAASVHPEPGSNSSLYIFYTSSSPLTPLISKEINALVFIVSRYLLVLIFQYYQWTCPCLSERDCKDILLFYSHQIFLHFFHNFSQKSCFSLFFRSFLPVLPGHQTILSNILSPAASRICPFSMGFDCGASPPWAACWRSAMVLASFMILK